MKNVDLPSDNPLRRFFSGLTEYVFESRLGVVDPPLIDYLSELLLRFTASAELQRVRALNGRPIHEVADMMAEANERIGSARREVHRHIGDVALFWTGVYPETLKVKQGADKKDHFIDYCAQGRRAYLIAGSLPEDAADAEATGPLLQRLGTQFEMCAYGLGELRREWERRDEADAKLWVN